MMPPALATKSGAHRMSRARSRSATASAASWLLAAPAIARQRRAGTVSSSRTPPSAHGASTSTSASSAAWGSVQSAPSSSASARLPSSTSATTSRAPASASPRASDAADAAEPHDGDRALAQVAGTEHALAGDVDRLLDAQRGPRAGVAGAAALDREAGDVARVLGDHRHVGVGGADVLGGHVAAVEHVDGVGEVEQGAAAVLGAQRGVAGAAHDHALAAPEREVGDGGLEGHRTRQAKRVGDRGARVGVAPHAAAAERGAARRRVDGDDREEPRPPAAADQQLLVLEGLQVALDAPEPSTAGG